MRPLLRFVTRTMLLVVMLALVGPTPALAAFECRGFILNPTIQGNLVVPPGETCDLSGGGTVTGNVTVGKDATFVTEAVTIHGSVRGDGFASVAFLTTDEINGNIVLTGGSESILIEQANVGGRIVLTGNDVSREIQVGDSVETGGSLTVTDNSAPELQIVDSAFGGAVRFTDNRGQAEILRNEVRGALSCERNQPAPDAFDNIVTGRASGQCANAEAPQA